MKRSTRILAALLLVLSCIGCDQVTKRVAQDRLRDEGRISLLSDTIRIEYMENEGAFLGLASDATPRTRFVLLTVVTGALLAVVACMLVRRKPMDAVAATALALVLGGGLGNWIDRIAREGRVVDFLNVGLGSVRTGIFNVADMAITAGVLLLFLGGRRARRDAAPQVVEARDGSR
jgi:signal peptidase II